MKIYDSLKRSKVEFEPIKKGKIGMYVCGPTVYDVPHIGHARSAYIFDVVRRYFQHKKLDVTFVRNVTDVDDKIIEKAKKEFKEEDLNRAVLKVSSKYLDIYHRDMDTLGILPPNKEPKATEYINKMIKFISQLIEKGAAYESGGDVYFDITKAKNYGKLSNQNIDELKEAVRIKSQKEGKKNALDFALWKTTKEGEPSWRSPWGAGRPGWHIECSVMSSDILGDEFDIHGGGIDLIFPHHENEIAQSEGADKKFAKHWMHNGLLSIDGEKMSKSLGNFKTIEDVLNDLPENNAPDILKDFFLRVHYSNPVDYSREIIQESKKTIYYFCEALDNDFGIKLSIKDKKDKEVEFQKKQFENAMDDNFNTPKARASIFGLARHCNLLLGGELTQDVKCKIQYTRDTMRELGGVLGLSFNKLNHRDRRWGKMSFVNVMQDVTEEDNEIENMVKKRIQLRKEKKFREADEIRKRLEEKGIVLEDIKDGTTSWAWAK